MAAAAVFALTVAQLVVGAVSGLEQFDGKAFGARLAAYPVMMLVAPVAWRLANRRAPWHAAPWGAFALIMAPFLIDVTGNTLDLYDRVWWWDDANHFANWVLLSLGVGVLMARAGAAPVGAGRGHRGGGRAAGDRVGAGGVVRVHPPRHREGHGVRGHAG